MFCAHELIFGRTYCVRSHFHVLRARLFFDGTEGFRSRFHVLRSRTLFRRCEGRRAPFSCFALLDSFSTVSRASDPVFMFCVPILVFCGNLGVESRFHDLRSRTHFWRCGVGSYFHVLRSRTHFRRFQLCQVPFSYYARPDSFSAVPRTSCPVFMFCAP
jgi:hypothetical protein